MFKVGSGDTLAYEPATYGHVGMLTWKAENSQNNWYYGITNYNPFDITAGSTHIFYFGGEFTVTINSDWSSYIPGQKVLLTNTFVDGYGNELHRVKFGKKHFWEDNTLVCPVIRIWDPNGNIIRQDSSENIFYNDSWPVNLPSDAVEGKYEAELSLNTGPHQGIIADTVAFAVSQEATSGGISYMLCDFDSAWAWATPLGNSQAPMFKITSSEILAFSPGDYGNVGISTWKTDDSEIKWFYGISNYDHFVIAEGSIDTFYFGGSFTVETETHHNFYHPGDEVVYVRNNFRDNFENEVHSITLGELSGDLVYPVIKIYDPNGVVVRQDSIRIIFYQDYRFTLPNDAVEGEYTVELKLNTGPHQGTIKDTAIFTVVRD